MNQAPDSTIDFEPRRLPTGCPEKIGKYEIRGCLGRGLSDVYLGFDPHLQRKLAIKVLRRDSDKQRETRHASTSDADEPSRARLLEEARRLVELDCDGVARVLECSSAWVTLGNANVEIDYMVYQLIDGLTLDRWFEQNHRIVKQLVRILIGIAKILGHIHNAGIVHRDIKPTNILVDAQGKPMIIDFGLAVRTASVVGQRAGGISGTLPFLSPEQASNSSQCDGRSDLFSLGVAMYWLLTRQYPVDPPRNGTTGAGVSQFLDAIQRQPVRPLRQLDSTIPAELERLCLKLLAKRPEDRYQNAWDLMGDLARFVGDVSLDLRPSKLLVAVQSHDAHWADTEADMLAQSLSGSGIRTASESPVRVISPRADTDPEVWREVITATIKALRAAKGRGEWTHLSPRLKVLAGFALGVAMDHQHDCQLYHVQASRIFPIWRMDRATKNARSPIAGQARPLGYLQETIEPMEGEKGQANQEECLAIQVGANPILDDVKIWRDRHQPSAIIRCLTKPHLTFPAEETSVWIAAASDIAWAIKASPARELYLFFDGPCTLALMAGDAIGHWSGKQLHLMQFVGSEPSLYVEVLKLPDEKLGRAIVSGGS